MNKYRVGLFYVTGGGVFQGRGGVDLETRLGVGDGYHLVGACQTTANEQGVYILATMQLDHDDDDSEAPSAAAAAADDDDSEAPSGFYEPIR